MTTTQHVINWSTACAVVGVAAIAAVASYEHAYALVRVHGEAGWTGRLVPLTVDGLIYARSRPLGEGRGEENAAGGSPPCLGSQLRLTFSTRNAAREPASCDAPSPA